MNIPPAFINQWQKVAEFVLSVLLCEEDDYGAGTRKYFDTAAFEVGLTDSSFPSQGFQLPTWRAISTLRHEGRAVHQTTVKSSMYGGSIDDEWLGRVRLQYSTLLEGDVFRTNAEALNRFGERYLLLRALDFAQQDLENDKNPDTIIQSLMSTLSNRGNGSIEHERADAQPFFDLFELPPEPRILSRITPIDIWTEGGLSAGEVVGIAAPEKSRKTTIALNWARNYVEQGASVAIFMLESTADSIKARFVSMFAIRWLVDRGLYNKADNGGYLLHSGLSGKNLLRTRNGYKSWHPYKVQAIEAGLAEFRNLTKTLRIYDRGYRSGKIGDIGSVQRVLKYDQNRYGTDLAVLDHIQRLTSSKNEGLYALISGAINALEAHARGQQISMILLSQLNENTKKQGSDAVTTGVLGDGGALSAAVDYMLKATYEHVKDPYMGYIHLNMFLSRNGEGGPQEKATVRTEPISGLMLKDLPLPI